MVDLHGYVACLHYIVGVDRLSYTTCRVLSSPDPFMLYLRSSSILKLYMKQHHRTQLLASPLNSQQRAEMF